MEITDYNQRLDAILKELFDFKEHHFGGLQTMLRVGRRLPFYNPEEFKALLKKLERDGYVTINEQLQSVVLRIEGKMFIGYEKQQILEDDRLTSIGQMAIATKKYNTRLLWATWFAGIAAFLLLLWQVFLWMNPTYLDFPYTLFGIVRKTMK